MDQPLMFLLLGGLLIIVAAFVQAFCEFGRLARPDVKPGLLKSWFRWVLEGFWAVALLAGGVLLLLNHWILALVAVVGFWLVLPFLVTPIMRHRLLPPWDEVKSQLAGKEFGPKAPYDERNYWRGDWWMVDEKQGMKQRKKSA